MSQATSITADSVLVSRSSKIRNKVSVVSEKWSHWRKKKEKDGVDAAGESECCMSERW